MLHQFRDARIRPQAPSACHDQRRLPFPQQFRRARCTVGIKIIIAQHYESIGLAERIFDDPRFRDKSENRPPHQIQNRAKHNKTQENDQVDDDAAPFVLLSKGRAS